MCTLLIYSQYLGPVVSHKAYNFGWCLREDRIDKTSSKNLVVEQNF